MTQIIDLAQERWKIQHGTEPETWVNHYKNSTGLISRQACLEGLRTLMPWDSLCELGCNAGPMLGLIAKEFPSARLTGVEVNPVAAEAAQRELPQAKIHLESLQEWLEREERVDVVLSHYTLAYVASNLIRQVLASILRLCNIGLVIAEPMGPEALIWEFPEWRHDYLGILSSLGLTDFQGCNIQGIDNLNCVLVARK